MNYSFITELEAKGLQLYDELRTLINVAVPNNEMKPGSVRKLEVGERIYSSDLKNGDYLYITDNVTPPSVVVDSIIDGFYIATLKEDASGKTIYEYSYYDGETKKMIEDNLDEDECFTDIVTYNQLQFELCQCGLLPDICGYYYLEELEGTNGVVDVIEKLKQDKSKQKVKA